ncbi:MAG: IS4 family transposase [Gemmatimonadales bacterium]
MYGLARGDVRTAASGAVLFERIVATGSLVLRRLGGTRAGEVAAHRYLSSPYVTAEGVVEALGARTAEACAGRRVVAAQDTTEINFSGRSKPPAGLGPGGDGETAGFFIHPVVVVDVESAAVLGVAHAQIWTRGEERAEPRRGRALEDKESWRWVAGAQAAAAVLKDAAQVVSVSDREGDIYGHFARRPETIEQIVRARHDRPLENEAGEAAESLYQAVARQPPLGTLEVRVAPRGPGDKGRLATVELRSTRVRITRPGSADADDPAWLELGVVEAREPDPPSGVKPLLWRLVTSLPVAGFDAAAEVVGLYRLRWRIEEVFRTLKRDGLRLEDTKLEGVTRLFILAALALGAAARIIQLVDARDGGPRPMSDVLDRGFITAAAAIGKSREGATPRQKNPHPQGSLAWLSWIVARHGGWNCYYKPPGPKTMAIGWQSFAATLSGYLIATAEADP